MEAVETEPWATLAADKASAVGLRGLPSTAKGHRKGGAADGADTCVLVYTPSSVCVFIDSNFFLGRLFCCVQTHPESCVCSSTCFLQLFLAARVFGLCRQCVTGNVLAGRRERRRAFVAGCFSS